MLILGDEKNGHSYHFRLGRSKDNIKINLKELGSECINWAEMAQDRVQWPYSLTTVRTF